MTMLIFDTVPDRFSAQLDHAAILDYSRKHAVSLRSVLDSAIATRAFNSILNRRTIELYHWVNALTPEKYSAAVALYDVMNESIKSVLSKTKGFNETNIMIDSAISKRRYALRFWRKSSPEFMGNPMN